MTHIGLYQDSVAISMPRLNFRKRWCDLDLRASRSAIGWSKERQISSWHATPVSQRNDILYLSGRKELFQP